MPAHSDIRCPYCGKKIIDEGVDIVVCPDCDSKFDRHAEPVESLKLVAPAWALVVTAIIGIAGNFCLGGIGMMVPTDTTPTDQMEFESEEQRRGYEAGRACSPLFTCCVLTLPSISIYPIILFAASQMRARKYYWLCMTGAVMAMLPCSIGFLIGLPSGIWAIYLLSQKSIREQFS